MWYFQGLPELALFVLTALFSGVVLVMVHRFFGPPTAPTKRDTQATDSNSVNQIAFLFDGPNLLDATPAAHNMIEAIPNPSPGLAEIAAFLEQRFPGLQKRLALTSPTTQKLIATNPPGSVARLDRSGESLRLSIQNSKASSISMDPMAMAAMREELAALRHIGESAPQLIWKLGSSNNVVWANAAYLSLVDQVQKPAPGLITDWPPLRLFSDLQIDSGDTIKRLSVFNPELDAEEWYDVTATPCYGGHILFATSASAIVKADAQSKAFVQTLTKTFAELSTGLAIFDRSRRLVMFNPALMELTQLPITFLSGQPVFAAVLDRLRDGGMLPEPKNYTSWRDEVAALEAEAEQGTYSEIWTMPGGQTYRVTGRPHPNGALAFLIDDISAEMTRTRSFRLEREVTQAVVDALDEAIAVFSPTGALVMTNAQYDSSWTQKASGASSDLASELSFWQSSTIPDPIWPKIYNGIAAGSDRNPLCEKVRRPDGRAITCRVAPLAGGATMVGFQSDLASPAKTSNNTQAHPPNNNQLTFKAG